jgi:hypothetical protein
VVVREVGDGETAVGKVAKLQRGKVAEWQSGRERMGETGSTACEAVLDGKRPWAGRCGGVGQRVKVYRGERGGAEVKERGEGKVARWQGKDGGPV